MTWKQLTERDCREWKLSAINPHDRHTWKSGVRSAICAASQLSRTHPLMWMLTLSLHVNQKSDYDDMMNDCCPLGLLVLNYQKTYSLDSLPDTSEELLRRSTW